MSGESTIENEELIVARDSFENDAHIRSVYEILNNIDVESASMSDVGVELENGRVSFSEINSVVNLQSEKLSFSQSSLSALDGIRDHIFAMHILTYLNCYDLSSVSGTCRFLRRIGSNLSLWNVLYNSDFEMHGRTSSNTIAHHSSNEIVQLKSKKDYLEKYLQFNQRVLAGKQEKAKLAVDLARQETVTVIETILDITQVRIVMPLLLMSLFISIILFCQKVDGVDISYWVCALPLLVSLTYLVLCIQVVRVVHKYEFSTTHVLRGMWSNFRGPVAAFYKEVCGESWQGLTVATCVVALCLLEVALVAVKLSSLTPQHVRDELHWGVVFIPLWCFFTLFCVSPMFERLRIEPGLFLTAMLLVWIPFFVFFVCLTEKLNGQQHKTDGRNIRLALIFMPFWVIEGTVLVSSLVFLLFGFYRYRRGFLERLDDHYMIFALCWISLVPFVIFQALLSARDDEQIQQRLRHPGDHIPTATETMIPFLIVIGWFCLVATVVSLGYRTGYQEARMQAMSSAAGFRVILNF